MNSLLEWIDKRTGIRSLVHEALFERVPGGARWRYVWGSTLVFAFATQMITGIFLWMSYSPSSRTAWESVYYIQYEMQFGWLLRGIHHYMAQAMVVLMAIHLLQVVIDGAYRAPREFNFWTGLILMQIVMGLGLTGYLLPWDQKGYWATAVATNLMGFVPGIGNAVQKLAVGGNAYGHHTLTRFFALHAGVLPGILIALLVIHIGLFRKHGLTVRRARGADAYLWPDQLFKDGVACLAVLAVVLLLCLKGFFSPHEGMVAGDYLGAELFAPADPSEQYAAARPEWYFLFLFELLKYFTPENLGATLGTEFMGAIVAPGLVMAFLFLMPFLGQWKFGHGFNVAMLIALVCGATLLTGRALYTDHYAKLFSQPGSAETDAGVEATHKTESASVSVHERRWQNSRSFLDAQAEAERNAHRIRQVIHQRGGIPYQGAIELVRSDPAIQGPKLFAQHCASCHPYLDKAGEGIPLAAPSELAAPNLYGFATREWLAGLLDPQQFSTDAYFGKTEHRDGQMFSFLTEHVAHLTEQGRKDLTSLLVALSAEAELPAQRTSDKESEADGTVKLGRLRFQEPLSAENAVAEYSCTDCHRYRDQGELGQAPDLTGYGSHPWLVEFISDPSHERFYRTENDRMPRFGAQDRLSKSQIELISRWLRQDY